MPPTLQGALNQMAASSMAELLIGVLTIQLKRGDIDQHAGPLLEVINESVVNSKNAMEKIVIDHLGRLAHVCKWKPEKDENDDTWVSECGNLFEFYAGGPEDNGMKFCPYCGRRLTTASTGQGGDSALEDGSDPEVSTTPE